MAVCANPYRSDRIALGVVLIIISTLCTSSQDTTFKFASSDMTIWQIHVMRSLFLIPIFLAIAAIWGTYSGIWSAVIKPWPTARAMMFILMYFSMFSVIPVLDLAVVAAGLYTGPLWMALLSPILLREPVSFRSGLAITLGFSGALINLRPGTDAFTWLALMPVLAGLFYALSSIITRSKCRDIPPMALSISLALGLLVTGVIGSLVLIVLPPAPSVVELSPFLLGQWADFGTLEWAVIGILTMLMAINGVVLPIAYQSAPTVIVGTFDYFYLVFVTVLGFLVFSEVPDAYTILGICMIIAAGLIILRKSE